MTSLSITVMTLNLHEGEQPSESPNSWERRRDICVSVITSYSPTILCTQQGEEGGRGGCDTLGAWAFALFGKLIWGGSSSKMWSLVRIIVRCK